MIVAMGSVLGTIKDTVDEMRDEGHKIGVLVSPAIARSAGTGASRAAERQRVVVLEKSLAVA